MSLFDRYIDALLLSALAVQVTAIVCLFFAELFDNAAFAGVAKGLLLVAFVVVATAGLFLLIDTVSEWFSSNEVDG